MLASLPAEASAASDSHEMAEKSVTWEKDWPGLSPKDKGFKDVSMILRDCF